MALINNDIYGHIFFRFRFSITNIDGHLNHQSFKTSKLGFIYAECKHH